MKTSHKITLAAVVVVAVAAAFFGFSSKKHHPVKPNVIVLLVDTLRADHLGTYGFHRPTSPNIDRFAAESLVFDWAIAASNWTPASVASAFTGLYPTSHGVNPPKDRNEAFRSTKKLGEKTLTLPKFLKSAGYQTGAVSSNPWVGEELGFAAGFDRFTVFNRLGADHVVRTGIEILDGFREHKDKPFFLYLHFMDPHNPFTPHPESEHLFQDDLSKTFHFPYSDHTNRVMRLYDGEILFADKFIGELFDYLKKNDLYDDTQIIFTADHGEQFNEHGKRGHGRYLYNEEVRIPLIVKTGDHTGRVETVVSNIDILPTVLNFLHVPKPEELPGISLLDAAKQKQRIGVFSEVYRDYKQQSFTTQDGHKLIQDVTFDEQGKIGRNNRGLYNFLNDRLEQKPLKDDALTQELANYLEAEYQTARAIQSNEDTVTISEKTINQLETLGYLK